MDALSDILNTLRLTSSVYFRKDFLAPWGMDVPRGEFAQFHMLTRGTCWIGVEGESSPRRLSPGDVIICPTGASHWLGDDPGSSRLPGAEVLAEYLAGMDSFAGPDTSVEAGAQLICGHFELNRRLDHPFLRALPDVIYVRMASHRELSWLESSLNAVMHEHETQTPGSNIAALRIAEVLFIQVLRAHMRATGLTSGFLTALHDQQIGTVLNGLHSDPGQAWDIPALAKLAGMSRSSLAARFKALVGMSPMRYVTLWRMQKARELIENSQVPLKQIAGRVGYQSDVAFHHAFKRVMGISPGRLRQGSGPGLAEN